VLRLFRFLLLVILVVLGLSFAVLNAEPVSLNYYIASRDVPLSLIMVLSLAAGALIGVLVSAGMILRLKQQTANLRRQLQRAERAADQLSVLPAKQ
jgi:lipopolysaccharide assembly protein A